MTASPAKPGDGVASFLDLLTAASAQPQAAPVAGIGSAVPDGSGKQTGAEAESNLAQSCSVVPSGSGNAAEQVLPVEIAAAVPRTTVQVAQPAAKAEPNRSSAVDEPKTQSQNRVVPTASAAVVLVMPNAPPAAAPLPRVLPRTGNDGDAKGQSPVVEGVAAVKAAPGDGSAAQLHSDKAAAVEGRAASPNLQRPMAADAAAPAAETVSPATTVVADAAPAAVADAAIVNAAPAAVADVAPAAMASAAAALPAFGDLVQAAGGAPKSGSANSFRLDGAGAASSSDAGSKDRSTATAAGSTANNSVGNAAASSRIESHADQPAADAAKAAAPISPQPTQMVAQAAPHAVATSGHAGAEPVSKGADTPTPAPRADAAYPASLNTAGVIQKMSESEMRVAVHSADYGSIAIRTSLSAEQMTTQITVDHGELSRALSVHAPAMEARLTNDLGTRTLIQVHQSGTSFSNERGSSQQGGQQNPNGAAAGMDAAPMHVEADEISPHIAAIGGGRRLDIQA